MDFRPRFSYPIAIALVTAFLISTGPTPARAAGIGDYSAPFQSLVSTFENVFAQLVAMVEPHHTVTVEISPAAMGTWHASGKTTSATVFNSMGLREVVWAFLATSERWEHACEHLEPQIFLVA